MNQREDKLLQAIIAWKLSTKHAVQYKIYALVTSHISNDDAIFRPSSGEIRPRDDNVLDIGSFDYLIDEVIHHLSVKHYNQFRFSSEVFHSFVDFQHSCKLSLVHQLLFFGQRKIIFAVHETGHGIHGFYPLFERLEISQKSGRKLVIEIVESVLLTELFEFVRIHLLFGHDQNLFPVSLGLLDFRPGMFDLLYDGFRIDYRYIVHYPDPIFIGLRVSFALERTNMSLRLDYIVYRYTHNVYDLIK